MAECCDVSDTDRRKSDDKTFLCGVVEGFYGRPWTSEQRRDLFVKMRKFGLNTYMYAPKDDFKHRAYWRDLYSVEEAEQLTSLIQAAEESDIIFFYALSPGLDITYSNPKEISALKRKLEQVTQFGCKAFALLFDDIEPEISETDKEVYQSFAHAQVAVANEIYEFLSHPRFAFCPTEYCAARAIPNVQNSEYLSTVGQKLHSNIDIMWTGPKVISKEITVESIQELTEVLRRPPLLWDNLHANDYDQKRLFLGPYCGRSTELISRLHGVLSNPNCEYETNFVPIHTLAQWSKCTADEKREASDSISADIKLENETEFGSVEEIPSCIMPNMYHPKKALDIAIKEWLPEFYKAKNAFGRIAPVPSAPTPVPACPVPIISACFSKPPPSPSDCQFPALTEELVESLVEPITPEEKSLEPMDCHPPSPKIVSVESIPKLDTANDFPEEMQTEPIEPEKRLLTTKEVSFMVDLFYLPFEHGRQGAKFLQEFHWLKSHVHYMCQNSRKKSNEPDCPEVQEWLTRSSQYDAMTNRIDKLLANLTFCPNRSLLYDLYPYIWDVKGVIQILNTYVNWIAVRRVPPPLSTLRSPPFQCYKDTFRSGDQEPWSFLGGLTTELQHLLPLESVNDLFLYKSPENPNSKVYTIRPYLTTDVTAVYDVCRSTCDDGSDGSSVFSDYPNLVGDKLVGHFLCLSPEYCFVVEDESGICGYALAALNAKQHLVKYQNEWIPTLLPNYPEPKKKSGDTLTPSEEMIASMHSPHKVSPPENIYLHHPSWLRMNVLSTVCDPSVPKRMLTCVLSTLRVNGSHGCFVEITVSDRNLREFYSKLGFVEIPHPGYAEQIFYMGRTF